VQQGNQDGKGQLRKKRPTGLLKTDKAKRESGGLERDLLSRVSSGTGTGGRRLREQDGWEQRRKKCTGRCPYRWAIGPFPILDEDPRSSRGGERQSQKKIKGLILPEAEKRIARGKPRPGRRKTGPSGTKKIEERTCSFGRKRVNTAIRYTVWVRSRT